MSHIEIVLHEFYHGGDIESTESYYFAREGYVNHQQFFPFDTEDDIRETIIEDFSTYVNEPTIIDMIRIVTEKCRTNHTVLIALFNNSVRIDAFNIKLKNEVIYRNNVSK